MRVSVRQRKAELYTYTVYPALKTSARGILQKKKPNGFFTGTGGPPAPCDGPHDTADRQAVEIVVDKDQDAERDRRQLGALAGLDPPGGPFPERRAAAGAVHQLHDHAQDHQEDQDAHTPGIRQGRDDAVRKNMIQRALKAEARIQERPCQDPDEERTVDFLCHQGQHNGDDGRDQRPEALLDALRRGHKSRNDQEDEHRGEGRDRHPYSTCLVFHFFIPPTLTLFPSAGCLP